MTSIVKNPNNMNMTTPVQQPPVQPTPVYSGPAFNVQAHRMTSDAETFIKTRGAFKLHVQNKGVVGIRIFGGYEIPSYGEAVFETGDPTLAFASDTPVEYDEHQPGDAVDIITTMYYK